VLWGMVVLLTSPGHQASACKASGRGQGAPLAGSPLRSAPQPLLHFHNPRTFEDFDKPVPNFKKFGLKAGEVPKFFDQVWCSSGWQAGEGCARGAARGGASHSGHRPCCSGSVSKHAVRCGGFVGRRYAVTFK
jgi:hypothetical protein